MAAAAYRDIKPYLKGIGSSVSRSSALIVINSYSDHKPIPENISGCDLYTLKRSFEKFRLSSGIVNNQYLSIEVKLVDDASKRGSLSAQALLAFENAMRQSRKSTNDLRDLATRDPVASKLYGDILLHNKRVNEATQMYRQVVEWKPEDNNEIYTDIKDLALRQLASLTSDPDDRLTYLKQITNKTEYPDVCINIGDAIKSVNIKDSLYYYMKAVGKGSLLAAKKARDIYLTEMPKPELAKELDLLIKRFT
ncbi:hypothetical protein CANCADRAFT_958 [Tortispora caseinolytica NRRL Y-17796]|uniref:Uncharacterized protein n=1 Tax=Tortispora caseinolytica NRRL Y-17796 TaxID=767744 RepID=A0A1E4TKS0_9ASCO|nr:hypothetical protein CANCADRAFT_958 [Tortispora caseinolytica NRRL Y-17796]